MANGRAKARRPGRIRHTLMRLGLMPPPTLALAPGTDRWAVKTGGDPASSGVRMTPVVTTIAALRALPAPHRPMIRTAPVEFTVYQVDAVLQEAHLESDGDVHLILADESGATIIAEIPLPRFVPSTSPWLPQITAVRAAFEANFGDAARWPTPNKRVQISGVGFFDKIHGQQGVAPSGLELHPVLALTVR